MIVYTSWINIQQDLFRKLRSDGKMTETDTRVFVYFLDDGSEVIMKQSKKGERDTSDFHQFVINHNGDVSFIETVLDIEKFAKENKLPEEKIYSVAHVRDKNISFSLTYSLEEFRIEPRQYFICATDEMLLARFNNVRHKRFIYLCYDFILRVTVNDRTAEYRNLMKFSRKRSPTILMTEAIKEVMEFEIRNYLRIKADFYPTDIGIETKPISFK